MRDYKDSRPRGRVAKKGRFKKAFPAVVKMAAVLAALFVMLLLTRYGYQAVLKSSYFGLKEIVVTGEKRVKRDEIVALSEVKAGESILSMDLSGISERIKAQPWIEKVSVRRVLPRGLLIDVKEREPFAILKSDVLYYLDRGGTPFKELEEGDEAGYPLITGVTVDEVGDDEAVREVLMKALDFIETEAGEWPADMPISEFNVNRGHGVTVFSNGIEIRLGFGDYKVKIKRLKRVTEELKAKGKTVGFMDLTYTGQVVVR